MKRPLGLLLLLLASCGRSPVAPAGAVAEPVPPRHAPLALPADAGAPAAINAGVASLLQPLAGGPTVSLPWGSILSPDDTFVLEPAYAHGFTLRLEHGRDVIKLDLGSGKKKVVSRVPPSAVPTPTPDDERALNAQTAVAIGPTGCVYATSHPDELAVHRARDDVKLAVAKSPGPGARLTFSRSGRYLRLETSDAHPRAYRLER